jgi:hypothetical protein
MTRQFATNDLRMHFFFVLGSALKCNVCNYWTSQPKEQQKCTNRKLTCPLGFDYCYTLSGTYQNGTDVVEKSCAIGLLCSNTENTCNLITTRLGLKSCAFECCNTNYCNSATGVMVTKFTVSLMAIVGFIFA